MTVSCALFLFGISLPACMARNIVPISTQTHGFGGAFGPQFSDDGQWLFFHAVQSRTGNTATVLYRLRIVTDELTPVLESGPQPEDDFSLLNVSHDGNHIVFTSRSKSLSQLKTNSEIHDLFWKDLQTGEVKLVSANESNNAAGDDHSFKPSLSEDGRYVSFESKASNLSASDNDTRRGTDTPDVFWRDMQTGELQLVSKPIRPFGAALAATGSNMSGNGKRVCFFSSESGLVTNTLPAGVHLFVWDADTHQVSWVDPLGAPAAANNLRTHHVGSWSNDGKTLVASVGINSDKRIIRYDAQTGLSTLLFAASLTYSGNTLTDPAFRLSQDGSRVIFDNVRSLSLWDAETGTTNWGNYGDWIQVPNLGTGKMQISADGTSCLLMSQILIGIGEKASISPQLFWVSLTETNISSRITHTVDSNEPSQQDLIGEYNISPNGNLVALESSDTNMSLQDTNGLTDIYLLDRTSGVNRCVSAKLWGEPQASPAQDHATYRLASLSSSGEGLFYVKMTGQWNRNLSNFMSEATFLNFSTGNEKRIPMLFGKTHAWPVPWSIKLSGNGRYGLSANLSSAAWANPGTVAVLSYYDFLEGTETYLATSALSSAWLSPGTPTQLGLSDDGQVMVWTQPQSTLEGASWVITSILATNQISLRRLSSKTNEVLSVDPSGRNLGDGDSFSPRVMPDGKHVIFLSRATQLTGTSLSPGILRLHMRDILLNITTVVPMPAEAGGIDTSISDYVVAETAQLIALNTVNNRSTLVELTPEGYRHLPLPLFKRVYALTDDGAWVLMMDDQTPDQSITLLHIKDQTRHDFHLNTWESTDLVGGARYQFVIAGDGRYVVYVDPPSTGRNRHVWIYDRISQVTLPISSEIQAPSALTRTVDPMHDRQGQRLLVRSWDEGLVSGDANRRSDWVMVDLGGEDSDGDNLSDAWELAYFNTLTRDGAGDLDLDGVSDAEEFRSGTNPTDGDSYLQFISIRALPHPEGEGEGEERVELKWASQQGRWYQVESKAGVEGSEWVKRGEPVRAVGSSASFIDVQPGQALNEPKRFYRIRWIP